MAARFLLTNHPEGHETMQSDPHGYEALSRRDVLAGGLASLVGLMLGATRLDAQSLMRAEADPRYGFADRLSDLVIPATDTPGGSQAKVAAFVLLALDRGMGGFSPILLDRVRDDLAAAAHGEFMRLSRKQQSKLLEDLDTAAFAARPAPDSAAEAWLHVKSAIVAGYYTSQIGASRELVYEPVPGSDANIELTPAYRSRSNEGFGGTL
jgi:hypothetical protein